jgi:NADH-quinone oxidoreductase subunit A
MDNYLPIVCMFVLSILFAALSFAASSLLGPKRPTSAKAAPYECGIVPEREPAERFPVRFYIVAMVFIVIDIEIIFLYPWAVIFRQLSTFGLVEMVLFAVAVLLSFIYLIGNGALDWGPVKRLRPLPGTTTERTTDTTVRRISQDTGEAA